MLDAQIEAILAEVQKPSRYIGGEAEPGREGPGRPRVRVACGLPGRVRDRDLQPGAADPVHAGQRATEAAWAERAYCPWPDMADAMRREGVPLFTLELAARARVRPVGHHAPGRADATPTCSRCSTWPACRSRRRPGRRGPDRDGGGPCASNPEPLAPFVDVLLHGRGRGGAARDRGRSLERVPTRASACRARAAAQLYVPARGRHPVERAVYASFDISTQPTAADRAVRVRDLHRAPASR